MRWWVLSICVRAALTQPEEEISFSVWGIERVFSCTRADRSSHLLLLLYPLAHHHEEGEHTLTFVLTYAHILTQTRPLRWDSQISNQRSQLPSIAVCPQQTISPGGSSRVPPHLFLKSSHGQPKQASKQQDWVERAATAEYKCVTPFFPSSSLLALPGNYVLRGRRRRVVRR